MSNVIDLKGSILSLTVLQLHSDNIAETKAALLQKIEQAPSFFAGIPVVLEPSVSFKDATYLALLLEFLHQHQMIPIGIRTESEQLIEQAQYIGLAVFPKEVKSRKAKEPDTQTTAAPLPEAGLKTAMVVKTSVRSGQQIFAKDRDLIVMGSINPGAEVVADGSVHVFGKVMGKVFAGASGETNACIFAKQLSPELICIAGAYQLAEDIAKEHQQGFVEVSLKNDTLIFNTKILD